MDQMQVQINTLQDNIKEIKHKKTTLNLQYQHYLETIKSKYEQDMDKVRR